MRFVVADHTEHFTEWARRAIGGIDSFGTHAQSIGLIDEEGRTLAAVIYTDYSSFNICMHVASDGTRRWMTKRYLFAVFDYPFNQLGCDRVTALVASKNTRSRAFCERIGFLYEGRMREAHHKDDLIVYGMLKRHCRWIEHGKAIRSRCA